MVSIQVSSNHEPSYYLLLNFVCAYAGARVRARACVRVHVTTFLLLIHTQIAHALTSAWMSARCFGGGGYFSGPISTVHCRK